MGLSEWFKRKNWLKPLKWFKRLDPGTEIIFLFSFQFAISFLLYLLFPVVKQVIPGISENLVNASILIILAFFMFFYFAYLHMIKETKYLVPFFQYFFPIIVFLLTFWLSSKLKDVLHSATGVLFSLVLLAFLLAYSRFRHSWEPVKWKFVVMVLVGVVVFFLGSVILNDVYSFRPLPNAFIVVTGVASEQYHLKCTALGGELISGHYIDCHVNPTLNLSNGAILFRFFNGTRGSYAFNESISFIAPENVAAIRFDVIAFNSSGQEMVLSTNQPHFLSLVDIPSYEGFLYKKEHLITFFLALIFLIVVTIPKFVFELAKEFENNGPKFLILKKNK